MQRPTRFRKHVHRNKSGTILRAATRHRSQKSTVPCQCGIGCHHGDSWALLCKPHQALMEALEFVGSLTCCLQVALELPIETRAPDTETVAAGVD